MKDAQHENPKRKQGKDPCGIQGNKCNDVVENQKGKERKVESFVPFVKHQKTNKHHQPLNVKKGN